MNLNIYADHWLCDHCGEDLEYLADWIARCSFCGTVWYPKVGTRHSGGFAPRYEVVIRV